MRPLAGRGKFFGAGARWVGIDDEVRRWGGKFLRCGAITFEFRGRMDGEGWRWRGKIFRGWVTFEFRCRMDGEGQRWHGKFLRWGVIFEIRGWVSCKN